MRTAAARQARERIEVRISQWPIALVGVFVAVDVDGQQIAPAAVQADVCQWPALPPFCNLSYIRCRLVNADAGKRFFRARAQREHGPAVPRVP